MIVMGGGGRAIETESPVTLLKETVPSKYI